MKIVFAILLSFLFFNLDAAAQVMVEENLADSICEDSSYVANNIIQNTYTNTSLQKNTYLSVSTNLLYDVVATPNIGIDIYLGKKWSVGGNWHYAWWTNNKKLWWKTYGGEIFLRRWFGKKAHEKPLTGHHLGVYGQLLSFDFDLGGDGIIAKPYLYGGGLEYGYSLPISRRLNLDFTLGIGFMKGTYKDYTPTWNEYPAEWHYVWKSTHRLSYIGPTNLQVNLVWLFGRGNENAIKKKGGER